MIIRRGNEASPSRQGQGSHPVQRQTGTRGALAGTGHEDSVPEGRWPSQVQPYHKLPAPERLIVEVACDGTAAVAARYGSSVSHVRNVLSGIYGSHEVRGLAHAAYLIGAGEWR